MMGFRWKDFYDSSQIPVVLSNALLKMLEKLNISIDLCRDQSYDNAGNMSGI